MAKKTLALITFLVVLTVILVGVAVKNAEQVPLKASPVAENTPTPTPQIISRLSMDPNPVTLSNNRAVVSALVDTSMTDVAAVQMEISFDPSLLTLLSIKPSATFTTEQPIVNTIDKKSGRISYILNRPANAPSLQASSSAEVATFTFSKIGIASGSATTDITFLPKSTVTARGTAQPVVTKIEGTTVLLIKPTSTPYLPSSVRISPTK